MVWSQCPQPLLPLPAEGDDDVSPLPHPHRRVSWCQGPFPESRLGLGLGELGEECQRMEGVKQNWDKTKLHIKRVAESL